MEFFLHNSLFLI